MGFKTGAWAKAWQKKKHDDCYGVSLSISKKDEKQESGYRKTFGAWATFYGEAAKKAEELEDGESIKLKEIDVTNRYDKDNDKTYTNYYVYDFDFSEDHVGTDEDGNMELPDEELPFN